MGASAQPHLGTTWALGQGPACARQHHEPSHVPDHVLAKLAPRRRRQDTQRPGLVRFLSNIGTAWKAVCQQGLEMRQPTLIPWPGVPWVAWCKKGCFCLRKGAEGGRGTL